MTFMEEKESVTVNLCVPGYTRGGLLVVSDSASLVTHNEQSATRVARYTQLPVTDSLCLLTLVYRVRVDQPRSYISMKNF